LSEVRRQIIPELKTSGTGGSVSEVDARQTDEKHTSVGRAQSSGEYIGEEALVICQLNRKVAEGDRWRP